MIETRKTYKDTVFRRLFGDSENKGALLSLYNALNGTEYTDPSELTINTIEDTIYMGIKNDISCIIDCHMVLLEQQSTYNPNMPLRGLMYFGKLYDQFIKTNRKNIYSSQLIQIPTPRYFVFYNGTKKTEDQVNLRLSDAFIHPDSGGDFEWTAVMININSGYNQALMESCTLLREYVQFIDQVRFYLKKRYPVDEAVNAAVDDCIQNNILKNFLIKNKSEVIDMCLTEYDEAETMQLFLEEGIEIGDKRGFNRGFDRGHEEGLEEGIYLTMFDFVNEGIITPEFAANRLNLSLEEFFFQMERYNKEKKLRLQG